jgi:viroplasmin and RNaseH domain-containing protein
LEKVAAGEIREKGDVIAYLGGGRFGVLHYANPRDARSFKIKKIIEWEDKDNRAEWRQAVAGHFSIT